jgi:tyrosine-protein kinase Etk/Wzc
LGNIVSKYSDSLNKVFKSLRTLVIYRKAIVNCIIFVTVITTTIVLLIPDWYKSTTSVFPVDQSRLIRTLGTVSSSMKSFSHIRNSVYSKFFSTTIGNIETDRCLAILKSNAALISVIQKFDLVHVYDIKSYPVDNSIKELFKNVEFKVVREGNVFITVYDKDPQRAADMANYFVEILNKRYSEIVAESIKNNKRVIDQYYIGSVDKLTSSEDSLKKMQNEYGIVSLPDQFMAYRNTVSEFAKKLIEKEIQANVLRKTHSIDHPNVGIAYMEVMELQNKLDKLNSGATDYEIGSNVFSPFNKPATFSTEYIRRQNDIEAQYKILQSMTSLNQNAEAEANYKSPAVIVIDRAVPAEREVRPHRILIIISGIIIGIVSAFLLSAFHDNWINEKNTNTAFYKLFSGTMKLDLK